MNEENSQDPSGLSHDELAAALGFITTIGTHHHMAQQAAAQPPEQPQEAPQASVEPAAPDLTPEVEKLQKEVDSLKKQITKDPKDELAGIRKMVEDALNSDGQG